jgi:hypothetical protein
MKSAKEWQQDIIKITIRINQDYPELSKIISEMTLKNSEREQGSVTKNDLIAYHISLVELIRSCTKTRGEKHLSDHYDFPTAEEILNQEIKSGLNGNSKKETLKEELFITV